MYRKIVVAVDGSATSLRGLDEAVRLAKAIGGRILLVHVMNELLVAGDYVPAVYYEAIVETLRKSGGRVLEQAVAIVRQAEVPCEQNLVEAIGGSTADAIVQQAKQWQADLIVLGTHGRRGLRRLAMGSDAEMVLRRALVPVLMVRDQPET